MIILAVPIIIIMMSAIITFMTMKEGMGKKGMGKRTTPGKTKRWRSFRFSFFFILLFLCIAFTSGLCDEPGTSRSSGDQLPPVLLFVIEEDPYVGQEVTIGGQIVTGLLNRSDYSVIIHCQKPGENRFFRLKETVPDSEGFFSASLTPDVSGEWIFRAYYCGLTSKTLSLTVLPDPHPALSYLTLQAWPRDPATGDIVTFSGELTGRNNAGLGGRQISYDIAYTSVCVGFYGRCGLYHDNLSWERFGSVRTDSRGSYTYRLPVVEEGNVVVRAVYEGDDDTSPAYSPMIFFSVRS